MIQEGKPVIDPNLYSKLRKRMLMFYFAAGINLVMAVWVMSAAGQTSGSTLAVIMGLFLLFAALNFYMARVLRKQWNAHVRQQMEQSSKGVNE